MIPHWFSSPGVTAAADLCPPGNMGEAARGPFRVLSARLLPAPVSQWRLPHEDEHLNLDFL